MPIRRLEEAKDYVDFAPDRIACQDATPQNGIVAIMQAGKPNSRPYLPLLHCESPYSG